MINNAKALPLWARIIGAVMVLMVLLGIRVSVKSAFSHLTPASAITSDYFSAHGPGIVKVDADLTKMVNDLVKISQGDTSAETMTDFEIQGEQLNRDINAIRTYDGQVPSEYRKADQELSDALDELFLMGDKMQDDIKNNDIDLLTIHAKQLSDGRKQLKQAAEDMIKIHDKK